MAAGVAGADAFIRKSTPAADALAVITLAVAQLVDENRNLGQKFQRKLKKFILEMRNRK